MDKKEVDGRRAWGASSDTAAAMGRGGAVGVGGEPESERGWPTGRESARGGRVGARFVDETAGEMVSVGD